MKFIILFIFGISNLLAQNVQISVYEGVFKSKIETSKADSSLPNIGIPFKTNIKLTAFNTKRFSLSIVEGTEDYNEELGVTVKSSSDTLLFDIERKLVYDFSKKAVFLYHNYLDLKEEPKGQFKRFYNSNIEILTHHDLQSYVFPIPIFQAVTTSSIQSFSGKNIILSLSKQYSSTFDFDVLMKKVQSFTKTNKEFKFSF
jgi:hypothetical protein